MLMQLLIDIVGQPPPGWEFVVYVLACILFICFFVILGNVFLMLFRKFWR